MMDITFVDIETTGLHPVTHVPWEIGMCDLDGKVELQFLLELKRSELSAAESMALSITNYYERCNTVKTPMPNYRELLKNPRGAYYITVEERPNLAWFLACQLKGIIAGNVVSFDTIRLEKFMRNYGTAPRWHYHLLDVEAFAAGALGIEPPYKSSGSSEAISERLGVKVPEGDEKHSALADAIWARDIYEAALSHARRRG